MKKFIFIMLILAMIAFKANNVQAQMSVSLPNLVGVTPGTLVDIPVWANNWNQVSGSCITISYNTIALTYNGYQNLSSVFDGGFPIIACSNGEVLFAWFMTTGSISFLSDTLFHLKFLYNGGCGQLNFNVDSTQPHGCYYPIANNGGVNCYASSSKLINEEIDFQIYPNPATEFIKVVFNSMLPANGVIQIIDTKGSILVEEILNDRNNAMQLGTAHLKAGNYEICILIPQKNSICKPFNILR